jgi:hypothetical protein
MVRGRLQTALWFLGLVFLLSSVCLGNTLVEKKEQPFSFYNRLASDQFEHSQKIMNLAHSPYLALGGDSIQGKESMDVYAFKGKSLKKAFVFSLIIPGSGEFYADSKIKAALFFGMDVAFWGLYMNYHNQGKDKEKEYIKYADSHWDRDNYATWLEITYGISSDTSRYWDPQDEEWKYLSHHLPDNKTQQYYEMIGKYEQFGAGWDDFDQGTDYSANRISYVDMRHNSNNLLGKAKNMASISIANHILSAFDAALSVRKYNKRGERFSQIEFKTRLVERNREIIPKFTASISF